MADDIRDVLRELRSMKVTQVKILELLTETFGPDEEDMCQHLKYSYLERGTTLVKVCADCGASLAN